jgi:hypothetical protein
MLAERIAPVKIHVISGEVLVLGDCVRRWRIASPSSSNSPSLQAFCEQVPGAR